IGYCHRELREFASAAECFVQALATFEAIDDRSSATRVRWNIAALDRLSGQDHRAARTLERVIGEFHELGMIHAATEAALDLAEIRLEQKNFDDVNQICRRAIEQFQRTGIVYSSSAMKALAYLRDAVAAQKANRDTIAHVRHYINE